MAAERLLAPIGTGVFVALALDEAARVCLECARAAGYEHDSLGVRFWAGVRRAPDPAPPPRECTLGVAFSVARGRGSAGVVGLAPPCLPPRDRQRLREEVAAVAALLRERRGA